VASQKNELIEADSAKGRQNNKINEFLIEKKNLSEKLIAAEAELSTTKANAKLVQEALRNKSKKRKERIKEANKKNTEWENKQSKWRTKEDQMKVQIQELINRLKDMQQQARATTLSTKIEPELMVVKSDQYQLLIPSPETQPVIPTPETQPVIPTPETTATPTPETTVMDSSENTFAEQRTELDDPSEPQDSENENSEPDVNVNTPKRVLRVSRRDIYMSFQPSLVNHTSNHSSGRI